MQLVPCGSGLGQRAGAWSWMREGLGPAPKSSAVRQGGPAFSAASGRSLRS